MHMRIKSITKNWWIWLLIGLGIGICLGKLFDWGYFVLNKEISIIEALNIFISIGLTIYIASVLEKRLKQEQFRSDLYVAKISEIEDILKQVEDLLMKNEIEYQQINTLIHVIGLAKNSLMKSLRDFNIVEKSIQQIDEVLKSNHRELKSLLTDRPIDKTDKSVIVKNRTITYSSDRITNIIQVCYSIKEEYFKLKVLLNG